MITAKMVLLLSIDCRQALREGALEARVGGLRIFPHFAFTCPFLQRAYRNQTGRRGMVCVYVLGLLSKKTTPEGPQH